MENTMSELTDKQKRFCEEYLVDMNGTQAAIRAGYSEKTANVIASENLTKPYINEYIKKMQEEARDRNKITVDFVINGIKDIALLGEHENNRLKAYDLLAKHVGAYEVDNTQKKTDSVVRIERIIIDKEDK